MSVGTCGIHGPQEQWSRVCLAIGEALNEGKAVGFVWGIGKDDLRWALSAYCDAEVEKGLAIPHDVITLCGACFDEAWALNGKPEKIQ